MSTYTTPLCVKTTRTRTKPSGWAAFDLKQRGFEAEDKNDSFPPIENSKPSVNSFSKSFSSVVENGKLNARVNGVSCSRFIEENDPVFALKKLKEVYRWANDGVIEDVLATVGNDVDEAAKLLKEMNFDSGLREDRGMKEHSFAYDDSSRCSGKISRGGSSEEDVTELAADIADLSSTLADALKDERVEAIDVKGSAAERLSGDAADNMKMILGHLRSVPVEPEWEDDDVYLSHRKDALRTMRLASQHSRAATNAFLRGDHFSAKQHSLKAQEGWLAAERLNSMAAKEILRVRNNYNDPWKLDLHGLHASEAVQTLQEHLRKIETEVRMHQPVSVSRNGTKNGTLKSPSVQSSSSIFTENSNMQQTTFRHRPLSLQVITGVGNHSRGQAALPTAVRNFLNDNGYRFDEPRPGVVTVKPKFRHR